MNTIVKSAFYGDADRQERDRTLGQIVALMLTDVERSHMALRNLAIWTIPPIYLEQVKVFYDFSKNTTGYVAWALCSEDTSKQMRDDVYFVPHTPDWNDGRELWIMDMVVFPSGRLQVRDFLVDMLQRFGSIRWVREKPSGRRRYYIKRSASSNV